MNKHVLNSITAAMLPLAMHTVAQPMGSYGYVGNRAKHSASKVATALIQERQPNMATPLLRQNPDVNVNTAADLSITRVSEQVNNPANSQSSEVTALATSLEITQGNRINELIIIDQAVPDKHLFYKDLKATTEVREIVSDQDGLAQFKQILSQYQNLDALHIVSHAQSGVIYLGNSRIDQALLQADTSTLATMNSSLKSGAEVSFYGCNLAAGDKGTSLLELIAGQGDVDVQASNNLTGSSELAGDWQLEVSTGSIHRDLPFSKQALQNFSAVLANMTITMDGFTATTYGDPKTYTSGNYGVRISSNNPATNSMWVSNYGDAQFYEDWNTDGDRSGSKVYFDFTGGQQFDITSIALYSFKPQTLVIEGGGNSQEVTFPPNGEKIVSLNWTGVTKLTISTKDNASIRYLRMDDFVLTNISDLNAAPTQTGNLPADITVIEDIASNVDLSAAMFTDADGDSLTVTLTANTGTLAATTAGGVTIGGSGTGIITLAGTAANINTYLDTTTNIKYTTATNNITAAEIAIKANDGTIDSATSNVSVNITDIADITSAAVPTNNTYGFSDNLDFSISFDESVSVTGTPRISLDIGGTTKYATFINGNTTATSGSTLVFRYTVEAELVDLNGIVVTNSIDLNGGSIVDTDAEGSGADLSNINFASTANVLVDGTAPTISTVSIPNSAHKVGDTVTATITVTSDSDNYTTGSGGITGTINGYALGNLNKINDTTYTATFTIMDGGSDVAAGSSIATNVTLKDSSANTSVAYSTAISQVSDAIYANLPEVNLTANTTTIAEDGGVSTLTATLSGSLNNQWPSGITVNLAYTGTGTAGTDYSKSDSIVIAAGNSSNTSMITATADTVFDAAVNETAIVDISSLSVGSEGATNQQTITITDAESAPTVTLTTGNANVAENAGTSAITAVLSDATYANVTVNLAYSGSATSGGTDYNTPSSSITILAGSTSANTPTGITSVDDTDTEGNESIVIDIASVTGGSATESGIQQKTVTIVDDDNSAPTLSNLPTTYTVTEDVASEINLSPVTFADTEGDSLSVTLTVSSGTIATTDGNGLIANVTISNSDTAALTLAGTIANIESYLDTVSKITVTTETNSLTDITLTVTPNDGVLSGSSATSTLSVTSVNDAPTLTATASNPTFTENGAAASLFSNAAVSTIEAGQLITGLTVTVTNLADSSDEVLNLDGSAIALVNAGSGTTVTNSFTYAVAVVGSTATVTLTTGSATAAAINTLVDALTYQHNSEKPTTTNARIVTLTAIADDGGTENSGDDVAALAVASTVTIAAVNDIPVITHLAGDSFTYSEDSGAVVIDQATAVSLTDVDSDNFAGGQLSVSITSGKDVSEDLLSLTVAGTVSLAANTAGAEVSVGAAMIGTLANNIAEGNNLVINLNANATPTNIQTLLTAITYSNTDIAAPTTGARTVRVILTDGDGGSSANNDVTITVTDINDVAEIGGDISGSTIEDNGTNATGNLTITDVDTGEAVFIAQTDVATTYGAFSLTSNGTWTYHLDNSKTSVQALANNVSVSDIITIESADGTKQQISITITGVNGTPIITGTSTGAVSLIGNTSGATSVDSSKRATGSLLISDEDTDEAGFVAQTNTAGVYGMFSVDSQGNWHFDVDSYSRFVQALAVDEAFSDSFLVWSLDGSDSQTVTISGYGINDAPTAKPDSVSLNLSNDGVYIIDVLANDSDIDGDAVSIVSAKASLGSVSTNAQQLTFTSPRSFVGKVNLTYTITDGRNSFAQGSVELTITGELSATAPVITVPATVEVNAKGLYTKVDLGIATALNSQGQAVPISLVDGTPLFQPGNNVAYWQAVDPLSGLTTVASQKVMVHPLISFSKNQTVVEGKTIGVDIILNGESPTYPVEMTLNISGSADASDYQLDSTTITIESGTQQRVFIDIVQDNIIEADETLILQLTGGNISEGASHTITIVERNIAPKISLTSSQNGETRQVITRDGGLVSIKALVDDANGDNITTQWQFDPALTMTASTDYTLTLDPSGLNPGMYSISLQATDDGTGSLSNKQTLYFEVITTLAVLTNIDSDGDLIPDNEEGYGDSDQDGIPDFQDAITKCNVMPEQVLRQNGFLVEGEPGVCLRKGNTLAAGETGGLQLTDNDLDSSIGKDDVAQIVGGVFDYIATGLPQAGQSYQIVLPQVQPIPTGAMYRKYSTVTSLNKIGWDNFVEDVDNQLHSAAGELGYCPPPQSSQWTTGLTAGDWCVRLTIKDGGANDNDGEANGTIIDPGGVGVILNGNHLPVAVNDLVEMVVNSEQRIDVLSNDSDADGDSLTITSATTNIGTVSISSAGDKLYYVSANNYDGDITINYGISDNKGGTAHAVVTITMILSPPPVVTQVIEVSKTTTKGGGGFFWPLLVLMGCLVTRRRIQD